MDCKSCSSQNCKCGPNCTPGGDCCKKNGCGCLAKSEAATSVGGCCGGAKNAAATAASDKACKCGTGCTPGGECCKRNNCHCSE
ncbi:hypothetical protein BOX15_Mlig008448g3 [Macrostomum lignano]|uniref:Uncharacterized protein n=1 Tax=Macrostomum lignano TaxID=282301 RepID=A0A267H2E1_9PLAT|nr:hypothetical protein BOX15_Mlig008448g3 [Macrostomum lignano]